MDPIVHITSLNLEGMKSGGNNSVTGNNMTVLSVAVGTNDERNLIQAGNNDCKTRIKRHNDKGNEISFGEQVRKGLNGPPEDFFWKNQRQNYFPVKKESGRKRHLPEEIKNESFATSPVETSRLPLITEAPPQNGSPKLPSITKNENEILVSPKEALVQLKRQNNQLTEALEKIQKAHAAEKKRFHEILFGIDKALSSLPIRLEKIRVRNQRNLTIIKSSRFPSGDGNENPPEQPARESLSSETSAAETSQGSHSFVSSKMKCLLHKMDQLNDLIHTIQKQESSPIELLVSSELHAISLLKKEIRSTKKQIEENKTDSEMVTSCDESPRDLAEDSSSKAKNSFSNELNKASNFKIFENHMMLQEEALNLLTRKIKETEEALAKEIEAKEGLKRENEAMAKEIFRLKSLGEELKGGKSQKTEKLKSEAEATGNRPFRLIKELKTKLEEKEKSLIAWKSKYARLDATTSNKTVLLEAEKKKNSQMETSIKNLKSQNKSLSSHINSLQFLNEQLRDQMQILKQQVEILANEKKEREPQSAVKNSKVEVHMNDLTELLKTREEKVRKVQEEAKSKLQELKMCHEKNLEELKCELKKQQDKAEEFMKTFKKLLVIINKFGVDKDIKDIKNPSYNRIREILHLSPSDLQLLFSAYAKSSAEKEVDNLCEELKSIVEEQGDKFSENLSSWLFGIIAEKLLNRGSGEKKNDIGES